MCLRDASSISCFHSIVQIRGAEDEDGEEMDVRLCEVG